MIKLFDDWLRSENRDKKPFLIMGKGPTIDLYKNIDREKYISIALNHVSKNHKVTIAHAIDYEVIEQAGTEMVKNAEYLLMPWYPNKNFSPHTKNLEELCKENAVLERFRKGGNLLTYNRKNGQEPCPLGGLPILPIYFSGDTLFQLLAGLGEKFIFSLGLDGGAEYSEEYSRYIPLENGRKDFNDQFRVINQVMENTGSRLIRIGDLQPIKVFVGTQPGQLVPTKVLQDSIKRNTHHPVFVEMLCDHEIPFNMPKDPKNKPRTPFSFQRFMIPSITTGKAFYLDSDMQVFGDMAELLKLDFGDAQVLACSGMEKYGHWKGSEYAVLLMDCDKIDWDINDIVNKLDSEELTYEELMFEFKMAKVNHCIPPDWNSLDVFEEGVTKLLHYTDMSRQPWRSANHPHEALWKTGLRKALDSGVLQQIDYSDSITRRHIRDVFLPK